MRFFPLLNGNFHPERIYEMSIFKTALHEFGQQYRVWQSLLLRARDHSPSAEDEAFCTQAIADYERVANRLLNAAPPDDLVTVETGTIQERTAALIRDAEQQGVIVTIALQHVAPLRMGGYVMVPDFRTARGEG